MGSLVSARVACSPASLGAECQDYTNAFEGCLSPPNCPSPLGFMLCALMFLEHQEMESFRPFFYPLPLLTRRVLLSSFYPLSLLPPTFVPVSSCCRLFLMKIFQSQLKPLSAVWFQHFVFSCVIVLSSYCKLKINRLVYNVIFSIKSNVFEFVIYGLPSSHPPKG